MKRITALVLVLVMICPFVFAACDNKGNTPPAGGGAGTTAPTTTKTPETKDPNAPYVYEPAEGYNYSGLFGVGTLGSSIEIESATVINRKDNHELYALDLTAASPLDGWKFASAVDGNWDADASDFATGEREPEKEGAEGVKYVGFTDTSVKGSMAYFGEPEWNYVRFNTKIKILDRGDGVAVYFCVHDEKNYHEVIIGAKDADGEDAIVVNSVVDGVVKEEGSMPLFLSNIEFDEEGAFEDTIPVAIAYDKDFIGVYVNSKMVFKLYGEVEPIMGSVGLGSWITKNSFDNLVVKSNVDGKVLYENDFSDPSTINQLSPRQYSGGSSSHTASITGDWQTNWAIVDDDEEHGKVLQNSATYEGNVLVVTAGFAKDPEDDTKLAWKDYTLEFDARIDASAEGWLVYFGILDDKNYVMWNVGGWGNAHTAFEPTSGGSKSGASASNWIDTKYNVGEWYHFKIVVHPQYAECFINDELIDTYSALL